MDHDITQILGSLLDDFQKRAGIYDRHLVETELARFLANNVVPDHYLNQIVSVGCRCGGFRDLTIEFSSDLGQSCCRISLGEVPGNDISLVHCSFGADKIWSFTFAKTLVELAQSNASVLNMICERWASSLPIFLKYGQLSNTFGNVFLSLGDQSHRVGLSFCDNAKESLLLPDSFFMGSKGYHNLRDRFLESDGKWDLRRPVAFWRGSSTGERVNEELQTLERVKLCLLAKNPKYLHLFDVGMTNFVQLKTPSENKILDSLDIKKDFVPIEDLTNWKYHIDIDGNTNSWPGLFSKLLSGSVVFKVESRRNWKQWYYHLLEPYRNYVPVSNDLSDLALKVDFIDRNRDLGLRIACAARSLAVLLDFESQTMVGVQRVEQAIIRSQTHEFLTLNT